MKKKTAAKSAPADEPVQQQPEVLLVPPRNLGVPAGEVPQHPVHPGRSTLGGAATRAAANRCGSPVEVGGLGGVRGEGEGTPG